MNARSSGPLTDADYQRLNKALADLENTHMEIQRARSAGFDCAAEDAQCQQLKESLARIKHTYFPQRA